MEQTIKEDKERLLGRLLVGDLSTEERASLAEHPAVGNELEKHWEGSPNTYVDIEKESRILHKVLREIRKGDRAKYERRTNRYLWAASIALFLVCGTLSTLLFTKQKIPQRWYVVQSGRQSMDSLRLPDGTSVMLNAGSRLTYPEKFVGDRRVVTLSGQAFFQVTPDKKHPFVVETRQMDITALGTAFEVFSFDNDKTAETILLEGAIKVEPASCKNEKRKDAFILHPDDKLTCTSDGQISIETVNADSYSAWRTGQKLVFRDEKLSMILPRLEKWYGQKIECAEEIQDFYRFTFTIRTEPLELMLTIMSHSAPLTYQLKNDETYVLKENT